MLIPINFMFERTERIRHTHFDTFVQMDEAQIYPARDKYIQIRTEKKLPKCLGPMIWLLSRSF